METLPVLFRKSQGEVTAVFPTVCGSGPDDMTCYAHVGQHGICCRAWYNSTRPANPEDYADLLAELRGIYERSLGEGDHAFKLRVYVRIHPWMNEARREDWRKVSGV